MSILITLIVLVVILVLIVFAAHGPLLDHLNKHLDEITGNDQILTPQLRQSIEPLVFKVYSTDPVEYSYRYELEASPLRRSILVSAPHGFRAYLEGEELVHLFNETLNLRTVAGIMLPTSTPLVLEVFVQKQVKPILHVAVQPRMRSRSQSPNR